MGKSKYNDYKCPKCGLTGTLMVNKGALNYVYCNYVRCGYISNIEAAIDVLGLKSK